MMPIDLSIVVASRNDNHGGNLLHRMRLFTSTLLTQLSKTPLVSELIIVEWNPPDNKPRLSQLLPFNNKPGNCQVRIITLPKEIHHKFPGSNKVGLYQFIAKNVGIRRANGKFILTTNIDILFSNELISFLTRNQLKNNELVRAIRFDVPSNISESWDHYRRLKYCRANVFHAYRPDNQRLIFKKLFSKFIRKPIFTNACGDFILMSKEFWFKTHGFPEFPTHGAKIDGLLCYAAYYSGAKQRILEERQCVYHLDHPGSWNAKKSVQLQTSLRRRGIPLMTSQEYQKYIIEMQTKKKPIIFNGNDWGLIKEDLIEEKL